MKRKNSPINFYFYNVYKLEIGYDIDNQKGKLKMNKSKILMLLPAFLLVGCAKSINKEDAQAKAKEINEYQEQHPITEFKFETYSLTQEDDEKEEETSSYEFSEEKVYFHIKAEETDMYAYKQDSKYYVVNAIAKQYYEFAGEQAKTSFDSMIADQKTEISQMFSGMARADIDGLLTKYIPAPNAEVKYSTKGDGSLIVEASYKGQEGGETGEISAKVVWDKYYPTEMSVKVNSSGEGHSFKSEMSVKFEYSVNPSYVDLSSYTKISN